jgi:hypothetical protein
MVEVQLDIVPEACSSAATYRHHDLNLTPEPLFTSPDVEDTVVRYRGSGW